MSVETQNKEDGEFVRVNNHDEDEEAQVRKLTAPLFDTVIWHSGTHSLILLQISNFVKFKLSPPTL